MPYPFLPKRKSGGLFADPTESGVWEERPNAHLETLGQSIEVSSVNQRIYSIPDPWARAILFDRALYDKDHLLHSLILGEWRGLLALLGLRDLRGFHVLGAREVGLNPGKETPGTFSSVLAQLQPSDQDLISARTKWGQFYVLTWQGKPFALTSPTTLVCTGAGYPDALTSKQVPWFKNGVLSDPTDALSSHERHLLGQWLLAVNQQIIRDYRDTSLHHNAIVGLVSAFASALDATISRQNSKDAVQQAGGAPAAETKPRQDSGEAMPPAGDPSVAATKPEINLQILGTSPLGMNHGIYRVLDLACKVETTTGSGVRSDVQIVTTKQGVPVHLLIDPKFAEKKGKHPLDVTIHGHVTLETSGLLASSGQTSGTVAGGISWCTPEFFFTDRLIYESNPADAFPGCFPVKSTGVKQDRNVVFPLNPEVFRLFTPREIAGRLRLEWQADGSARCSLNLTLTSGEYSIEKKYGPSEMVRIANLPLVCLWPNFRLRGLGWKAHYTFQWHAEKEKEELSVTPWSEAQDKAPPPQKHSIDGQDFQIYRTDSHPEALICKTPYFDPSKQRQATASGLLLLKIPEEHLLVSTAVDLGVDFGSTGSNVYMHTQGSEPEAVTFRSRVQPITDFDITRFSNICRDLFVPNRDWPAESILSVFNDFGDPPEGDTKRRPLLDGHVLYADDPQQFLKKDRKRIVSNLKWGGERERILARDFLAQLCLQAAAEVAAKGGNKVDIRFSFPTAFSGQDLSEFESHWRWVAKKVHELTGVESQLNLDPVNNSEAVAATCFFSLYKGNQELLDIGGNAITIDIGGGTTDFAVWNRESLLKHSSVIFAGRDIFLEPLRRKPQVLNQIDPRVMLDASKRDDAFNAQLDAVILRYGEEMVAGLATRLERPSVKELLSIVELGLCGITFYAGLLVRGLTEAGALSHGDVIAIFVGGNGSKLFNWCSLGPNLTGKISQPAINAFTAGANLKDVRVLIQLSAKPKSEVAYGLVCNPFMRKLAEDFDKRIAGECYLESGVHKEWKETPAAESIRQAAVRADRTFPIFSQFLQSINRPVDPEVLRRLGTAVDNRLSQQAQEINKDIKKQPDTKKLVRNEPIFITALNHYLGMEIHAWERNF